MSSPGQEFAEAIADRSASALMATLSDEIDFTGLTPGRTWTATTPREVVDAVLGNWFGDNDRIESATWREGESVVDTHHVSYRFEIVNGDGPHEVEQQVYYRAHEGRITWMRVVCSGFRPRSVGAGRARRTSDA
jgi:hypothetical protein